VAGVHKPPKVEEREIEILSADRVDEVLAKLDGHALHPIAALALSTGMRRGELLGLQWGDVDLDDDPPFLRVERSVEETKAGLRLKPPKTKRGQRNITLPPETVAMLRAHKVSALELRLVGTIKPDTLVFSTVDGGLLSPDNLSRDWGRVVKAKGLPHVSFHALRHTHVSMLIRKGVDILLISRCLGHSKASINTAT
jgi:integrase